MSEPHRIWLQMDPMGYDVLFDTPKAEARRLYKPYIRAPDAELVERVRQQIEIMDDNRYGDNVKAFRAYSILRQLLTWIEGEQT